MVKGKDYHRWYNINVRGRPEKANMLVRIKCLLCGNLAYPSALGKSYQIGAKFQRGYNQYFELEDPVLAKVRGMLYESMQDKYKKMAHKCANLLREFVVLGLITEADIKNVLGFADVSSVDRPGEIASPGLIAGQLSGFASRISDIPVLQRLNGVPTPNETGYTEEVEYG